MIGVAVEVGVGVSVGVLICEDDTIDDVVLAQALHNINKTADNITRMCFFTFCLHWQIR
jgi:hypothetical protein